MGPRQTAGYRPAARMKPGCNQVHGYSPRTMDFARRVRDAHRVERDDYMAERMVLRGRYEQVNEAYLNDRANRTHDPRSVFYRAMVTHDTYEAYAAAVAGVAVTVPSYGAGDIPISGRDENSLCPAQSAYRRCGRLER